MDGVNWLSLLWSVFWKLVELATALYNFLFYEVNAGSFSFSLWQVLGGGAIVTLLVARLIKLLVPVA